MLSSTFRCCKSSSANPSLLKSSPKPSQSSPSSLSTRRIASLPTLSSRSWCVYLVLSTNTPIKTYVGVTNDFPRRLKQHNGELKGGAKASRAGRPWICACLVRGFEDRSQACEFESKWKSFSRKLPRKGKKGDVPEDLDKTSLLLLQHRQAALNRVKVLFNCCNLEFDWQLDPH